MASAGLAFRALAMSRERAAVRSATGAVGHSVAALVKQANVTTTNAVHLRPVRSRVSPVVRPPMVAAVLSIAEFVVTRSPVVALERPMSAGFVCPEHAMNTQTPVVPKAMVVVGLLSVLPPVQAVRLVTEERVVRRLQSAERSPYWPSVARLPMVVAEVLSVAAAPPWVKAVRRRGRPMFASSASPTLANQVSAKTSPMAVAIYSIVVPAAAPRFVVAASRKRVVPPRLANRRTTVAEPFSMTVAVDL